SRLTSDSYHVHNMLSRMQRLGVRAPILLLGGIVMTLNLDPALASVLLCLMPVLGVIMWLVTKRSVPMYSAAQEAVDGFVRLVREDIAGIRVIKALSKMDYEEQRFDDWNRRVVERERAAGITMAVLNPSMNLLLNIGLVGVILAGALRVQVGVGEVGTILAFLTYFTIILNAMLSISRMFTLFSKGQASAERISLVLESEDERQIEERFLQAYKNAETEDRENESGTGREEENGPPFVAFRDVTFSYNPGKPVLRHISFALKKGESLGIIGETGSGKTTIASLLLGLYPADSGQILAGGQDIREQTFGGLREKIGIVFQSDTIFEDTIYENVRLGRELTKKQVERAIHTAQADEFIQEKEGKNQEQLNIRGANLSGGQKQRILIARALAGEPDILILDDSSSALDYQTDMQLRRAIRQEYPAVTGIFIAQRISSISHADHIMMLENGQVLGYGTHEELLENCAPYRELYQMQTGDMESRKTGKDGDYDETIC
ncbi:MAG: ABC transporter ATP-binding protein, partial [Lachnospiraceae bacterium]|nr:ABC transporter ATP-binding protein [Lachnospiraceae bacterium]